MEIEGNNQEIYGKLRQHYGFTREEIEKQLRSFTKH
ncbi:CsbD family protein [Legionella tunisiensis]